MNRVRTFKLTGTSPAAAGTAYGATPGTDLLTEGTHDLSSYDWWTATILLTGATGGALNVYLQRKVDEDYWLDWIAFPQIAAAAPLVRYTGDSSCAGTGIVVVGGGAVAAATPALAAGLWACASPGNRAVRLAYTAGVGTSAGAAQVVYLDAWRRR